MREFPPVGRFAGPMVLALLALLVLAAAPARAQQNADTTRTREVDVRADLLEEDVVGGVRVRRLTGNVELRQGETHLWSQRAVQYLDRREILFLGDVLVVERGDTLQADSVLYNRGTKVGRASGHVELSDGDVLVSAPSGRYFTREKRAEFTEGVRLVDSTAVLSSRGGEYWSDEKRAEFYGMVRLDEERTHLEADSVSYFRETDISVARGNVFIERSGGEDDAATDTLTRTLLFGEQAYNEDSTAYSRIEGRPLLVQLRQDSVGAEVDTMLIRAVVLESSRADSLQRLIATDSVRIWQRDLAATADSVVYDRLEAAVDSTAEDDRVGEQVRLFGSPIAWLQNNQVSGDTMHVRARDDAVDSLFVRTRAFVARLDTASGRIQQLRGQNLAAAFEGDSLRTLEIGPQAEAINFRTDEDGRPAGAVKMSADRIVFYFRGDELARLNAERGTEGTYYPEELMPSGLALEGFRWVPERMPTKAGLLGPVVIPPRTTTPARSLEPFHAGAPLEEHVEPVGASSTR